MNHTTSHQVLNAGIVSCLLITGIGSIMPDSAVAQYCAATGGGCDPANNGDHIRLVKIENGFINFTTCESNSGYGDYTHLVAPLVEGAAYQVGITADTVGHFLGQLAVWIDWNSDYDFSDAGESVFAATTVNNYVNKTTTFVITPPSGVSLGRKRMRVRTASTTNTMSPCGNEVIGEVEDYTIVVVDPTNPSAIASFTSDTREICLNGQVNFTNASSDADSVRWLFEGRIPATSNQNNPAVVYDTIGDFTVQLIAYNSGGNDTLTRNDYIKVNPGDDASFSYSSSVFCLSDEDPTPAINGMEGGFFTATPDGLDINPENGTISLANSATGVYTVTYQTAGTCPASNDESVEVSACTGIEENDLSEKVKIYPNPASDAVYLETTQGIRVNLARIFSVEGRELLHFNLNRQMQFNISALPFGIYFIELDTSEGQLMRKLHVVR